VQGNEKERIRKLVRFRSGEREIERERKREKETGEKGELDAFCKLGKKGHVRSCEMERKGDGGIVRRLGMRLGR
jgi:hypothetical protein